MRNRWVMVVAWLLFGGLAATAQERGGELNRAMEVTRAYEPTVNEANKLQVEPNLIDTLQLRPEFGYEITPAPPRLPDFEVTPIRAATVQIDPYSPMNPLYAKVAVGYPMQSLADLYLNTTGHTSGMLGAYLNHDGSWGKLDNGDGIRTPASQTFNKLGLWGERRGRRYLLNGEIGVDYDMVTRYGYSNPDPDRAFQGSFDTTASALRQHFTTLRAKVGFGDTFEDLSHFNFRVGVAAAYFFDRFDASQTRVNAYLDLGKRFGGGHEVTLHTQYEGYFGAEGEDAPENNIGTVALRYHLRAGTLDCSIGAALSFDSHKCYFYPHLALRYDATQGHLVPFVELDGQLTSNDYQTLASANPYIRPVWAPNSSQYQGRVGLAGSFSSAFSYQLYGGLTHEQNRTTFANLYLAEQSYGNLFGVLNDTVTTWTVGADLEGRVSGAFGLELSVQYQGFSKKRFEHISGLPHLTGRLDLRYTIRDKAILTAGATLQSHRWFALSGDGSVAALPDWSWRQVGTTVDVRLGAEYRISETVGLFLQGNNLANQKLEPYCFYRGLGINALAGVTLSF